jgi:glycosyltransferase involved in cell wall biosynthesis
MRILFLLTQDLHSPSGLGRYYPLAKELLRLGNQVTIAALHSDFESLTVKRQVLNGIDVRYVAPMHVKKRGDTKTYYPPLQLMVLAARAAAALTRAGLQIPADILHVGKPHPMNAIAGLAARSLRGRALFLDLDDVEAASNRFQGGWQQQGVAFFEKIMPGQAAHITTNTQYLRGRLMERGIPPSSITYLPNGIDRERFAAPDPAQLDALRCDLGLVGKKVLLFIGTLSLPSHPVDLLLTAFQRISCEDPEARLLVVGGGEDYGTLHRLASDLGISSAVRFTGRVTPDQVPAYYSLAGASVDPVRDDEAARGRSPLKLFESWACGTPFISCDVGDRRDLLGDPPAGVLVRPGEPESLAQAIRQVLYDPPFSAELVARGKQRVVEYTWDRLAKKLDKVYREFLERKTA